MAAMLDEFNMVSFVMSSKMAAKNKRTWDKQGKALSGVPQPPSWMNLTLFLSLLSNMAAKNTRLVGEILVRSGIAAMLDE